MTIENNILLADKTTFKVGGQAKYYVRVTSEDELSEALDWADSKQLPFLIIGSGSNMLVSDNGFDGLVIEPAFRGMHIRDAGDMGEIEAFAGESWDDVVALAVLHNLWGIENLSAIPGTVGAFPVQNVGAYGQEASQVIKELKVLDILERSVKIIPNIDCGFEYRHSNFNSEWRNKFVILSVTFILSKEARPNLSYRDVEKYFIQKQANPTISEIRQAIIEIRKGKFPNLDEFGCAGSFFKNLVLTPEQYLELEQRIARDFPEDARVRLSEIKDRFGMIKSIKIPAAFLIDICGLKGKVLGGAKLWEKQPLVIVNTGTAKASEIASLFREVQQEVLSKTGLKLMPEPEFIGFSPDEISKYLNL